MVTQVFDDGDFDLDALDAFLLSDRAPENSMGLSDLDGFLTAIAIGPEPVKPGEWLPVVWGGEDPVYEGEAELKAVHGAIFGRYNEILRLLRELSRSSGWERAAS